MRQWRIQLLILLGLVTVLPAVPTAWTAHVLFREALQPLLGEPFREGVRAGLESTRRELERNREEFSSDLNAGAAFDTLTPARLARLPDRDRNTLGALDLGIDAPPIRLDLDDGSRWVTRHTADNGRVVWAGRTVPDSLLRRAAHVEDATLRIETLRLQERRLARTLLATFLTSNGIVVLLALALGLFLMRRWTEPLASLGEAIESVADGDLSVQVAGGRSDEMRRLLERFNRMVAELRSQREEIARFEKRTAWQQMARSLAHEIKNPLTPIQLAAQELRTAYKGTDPNYTALVREGTQIVEEEVERLRLLVQGFSQLARPPKSFDPVDLNEIGTEMERTYGDRVTCLRPSSPSLVRGDRDALRRIFFNLINNAIEAQSRVDGTEPIELTIRVASPSRQIIAEFRDHGPGVDRTVRHRIFEPDFTTRSDGIGLGLAIARSTAEAHSGTLEFEDAAPGARFRLSIPAATPNESNPLEAP